MFKNKSQIGYERAERLKSIRLMANLKRHEFADLAAVSPTTVSYWENVTHAGLTEDGARKTVKALEKVNIICTVPWLMFGTGEIPYRNNNGKNESLMLLPNADIRFDEEVALFQRFNDSVVFHVPDEALSPLFFKNDVVGGIWRDVSNLVLNDWMTYIVSINNSLLLRKIRMAGMNKYDLYAVCLDPNATTPYEIKGVSLTKIAPVIRFWRDY